MGKSKKKTHKPKSEDTNQEKIYLLHMDLCGPIRVESVNGKKYILVIINDYFRFTWVKCLRSKDEALDFIIMFLKMIQVRLKVPVRRIRTDNGTEFDNQTLREYYEQVGISRETSVARSSQQNGVVERRNHTLIEATRTIENLGKLQPKADIGIFIGYAPTKKAFRIYNRRTRRIVDTIHVEFDELTAMASEQSSLGPALHEMTHATMSSGLMRKPTSSTPYVPPSRNDWDLLFQPLFDELLTPPSCVDPPAPEVIAPIADVIPQQQAESTGSPSSTTVDQDATSPSKSQTTPKIQSHVIPQDVEEDIHDIEVSHIGNDPLFGMPILEVASDQSSSTVSPYTIVHPDHQIPQHISTWIKDYPLDNIIGQLSRPVSTRLQLHEQALFCYYHAFFTYVEPKTYKDDLTQSCWIKAMQEELNEFERLELLNDSRTIDEMLKQHEQAANLAVQQEQEEQAAQSFTPNWNFSMINDDEEHSIQYKEYLENSSNANATVLPTEEPEYSLSMGYEHLSTISETKSDEVIKSSAKNLVPILSEYEVTSDDESEYDVPVKDESSPVFTTFSNSLFDCNDDFTSSDDESISSDEDVPMENFKVCSNPLFDDEEINSDEIDPRYFNAESDLIESLSNHDTLFDSSLKFDYLEEFSYELIPSSIINEERIKREHEEYISLMEKLLAINSFPRPMENFHANTIVETLPTSPIPVEDSNSLKEEIDIFTDTNDLLPPGIESDDYDSEGDIHFLEKLLSNDSFPLPENESSNFDHDDSSFPHPPLKPPDVEFFFDFEPNSGEVISAVMNNIDELNEDECFDPGGSEDTIFDHGISIQS
uniref:Putative ribonuclease H-like domain-containing protein n=1 Tax=Tanacetum cinerariifolium TaxID=118510 RepID=A0A699H005_TANCI|nr:putative ribonuclease H-like domain-containing protein [Tanacetum cinerariifolium]